MEEEEEEEDGLRKRDGLRSGRRDTRWMRSLIVAGLCGWSGGVVGWWGWGGVVECVERLYWLDECEWGLVAVGEWEICWVC